MTTRDYYIMSADTVVAKWEYVARNPCDCYAQG